MVQQMKSYLWLIWQRYLLDFWTWFDLIWFDLIGWPFGLDLTWFDLTWLDLTWFDLIGWPYNLYGVKYIDLQYPLRLLQANWTVTDLVLFMLIGAGGGLLGGLWNGTQTLITKYRMKRKGWNRHAVFILPLFCPYSALILPLFCSNESLLSTLLFYEVVFSSQVCAPSHKIML